MADEHDDNRPDRATSSTLLGAGIAIGAGVGTALFAATNSPVWIGVGVAIGVAVGAAIQSQRD